LQKEGRLEWHPQAPTCQLITRSRLLEAHNQGTMKRGEVAGICISSSQQDREMRGGCTVKEEAALAITNRGGFIATEWN